MSDTAKATHTPGPWTIFKPYVSKYFGIEGDAGKISVVEFADDGGIVEIADARLIAAANINSGSMKRTWRKGTTPMLIVSLVALNW